ncbi:hypothetical protein A2U01_0076254, partial [Trifolium medium]|nr:hypothetical protein [Trifolium medium]
CRAPPLGAPEIEEPTVEPVVAWKACTGCWIGRGGSVGQLGIIWSRCLQ